MLVVTRLRVPAAETEHLVGSAREALAALADRPGYLAGELGRAADDRELWVLSTRWASVGAYRRALSSYDVKVALPPVVAFALNEPSAYELVDSVPPGGEPV